MTSPSQSPESSPAPHDASVPAEGHPDIAPGGLELGVHTFWQNNRNALFILCGLIAAGIVGKGVYSHVLAQRDIDAGQDFAAATTPAALKAFSASHAGTPLAAIADLKVADAAYEAGNLAEAATDYQKAADGLTDFLAVRARLGQAMAEVQTGRLAEGQELLRTLSSDATPYKSVRAQAYYQLASLASEAGKSDEVQRIGDELVRLDPQSPWTQRVFSLRSRKPAAH